MLLYPTSTEHHRPPEALAEPRFAPIRAALSDKSEAAKRNQEPSKDSQLSVPYGLCPASIKARRRDLRHEWRRVSPRHQAGELDEENDKGSPEELPKPMGELPTMTTQHHRTRLRHLRNFAEKSRRIPALSVKFFTIFVEIHDRTL